MAKCKTRSEGQIFDFDKEFPSYNTFQPPKKLPTFQSVIGLLKYHLEMGSGVVTTNMAVNEVAKQVYSKYYHDTVYCLSVRSITRKIEALWKLINEGKKRSKEKGRQDTSVVKDYKKLFDTKHDLFDVYAEDDTRKKACEEEWGVKMTDVDFQYYQDQKTDRKMTCERGVDPVWYETIMRSQRQKEREEKYRSERDQQFQYKSIDKIRELLIQSGEITDSSSDKEQVEQGELVEQSEEQVECDERGEPKRKKRRFSGVVDVNTDDLMPDKYQHIRISERKVRPEFYLAVANLIGLGLSVYEASSAIVEIGNKMFGRKWKIFGEYEEIFDMDTAPSPRNIRLALHRYTHYFKNTAVKPRLMQCQR